MDLNLPTIGFFSKRVINRGEELSFDYNMNRADAHREELKARARNKRAGSEGSSVSGDSGISTKTPEPAKWACKCGTVNCRTFYM